MRFVTTKYQLICNTLFVLFWVMATYNFATQEIMGGQEVPAVEVLVRLAAQGVLVVFGLWTLRSRTDIVVLIAFTLLSLISTCVVNHHSLMTWIDGMRLYVGFLFVVPIIRYLLADEQFRGWLIERFDRNLYRFLWLQVPCIVWQFLRYTNLDYVGGSLGFMQSGIISNLIYLVSFYLMLRRWDKDKSYFANIRANMELVFLLFPTMLNETKVSFVFLLMYFFFLIPMDRNFIKRAICVAPALVLVMVGAFYAYTNAVGGDLQIMDKTSAVKYLMGDESALNMVEGVMERNDEFMQKDMARALKFIVVPAIMNRNPPSWFVGYGIGQFKTGDSANKVPFAKQYWWLMIGTVMQAHTIWLELGLIGVGLYFIYWPVMLCLGRKRKGRNKQMQWFLGLNVLLCTVYNAPMLNIPYVIIFMAIMLISSVWTSLPPYQKPKLLGSRPINWSIRKQEVTAN